MTRTDDHSLCCRRVKLEPMRDRPVVESRLVSITLLDGIVNIADGNVEKNLHVVNKHEHLTEDENTYKGVDQGQEQVTTRTGALPNAT